MKIRRGFVSNSSSSSFLIIDVRNGYDYNSLEKYLVGGELTIDGKNGENEFGWGPDTLTDVWSKLNFACLQMCYTSTAQSKKWKKLLIKVIKDNVKGCKAVEIKIATDYNSKYHGYIDHQSCAGDGRNIEIFESYDMLRDFIFGKNSEIRLDNDNH